MSSYSADILRELAGKPLSIAELADRTGMPRPLVNHWIQRLRADDLVWPWGGFTEVDGAGVYWSLTVRARAGVGGHAINFTAHFDPPDDVACELLSRLAQAAARETELDQRPRLTTLTRPPSAPGGGEPG